MKILYHHRTASKDGQAVHIDEMIAALREHGHTVKVVAPGDAAGQQMGANVGWAHRLRAWLPLAVYELMEFGYSIVAYRKLARAVREFRPDVLYERCNLFLIAGAMISRRRHLPLMLEVNSPLADERERFGGLGLPRLARWSERFVWRSAQRVLPVTQVLADIVQRNGVPASRIVVIPNGINEAHFACAPSAVLAKQQQGLGDTLVLGFTGFVRDWHGVDRVLRWMAGSQAPAEARLLVVGDGPARGDLEALARTLGIAARVRFTGVLPRGDIPAQVAAFDIALQPAVTHYASPLKLFEYLALGKAIIAPRTANITEVLTDGDNALLFEADDALSFEQVLTRLSHDAALRQRLGTRARATINERGLTWAQNGARVGQLAREIAQGTAGPIEAVEPAAAASR